MKTMNDEPTPPADEPHLVALIEMVNRLVGLMSDPKAVQARLSQLSAAHSDAKAASAAAVKDRAEADEHLATVEREIAAARERHGLERDKHHEAMRQREADMTALEQKAAVHLKAAQEHEQRAAAVRSKLEAKLAALQAA
jgi:hypothetical protein